MKNQVLAPQHRKNHQYSSANSYELEQESSLKFKETVTKRK